MEGMDLSMVGSSRLVTGGVDTHLELNVAAVLDRIGGLLGTESFPTTMEGNRQLLRWMTGFGRVIQVGVEGTGSYGAPLARFLRQAGIEVLEVDRPNREERRRKGKTDVIDAIEAARSAQGQRQLGAAKTKDGKVEAIRALLVAKRSARDTKIKTLNQIRHLGFTAPEEIRQALQGLSPRTISKKAAAMRPNPEADPVIFATKTALRALGRRVLELDAERKELDRLVDRFLAEICPELLELYGVGKHSAATLLVAAATTPTG
jgi:transposase